MSGGFGLVAFPAKYASSGVMTFVVNQDGVVYEKDLGPETPTLAPRLPDATLTHPGLARDSGKGRPRRQPEASWAGAPRGRPFPLLRNDR